MDVLVDCFIVKGMTLRIKLGDFDEGALLEQRVNGFYEMSNTSHYATIPVPSTNMMIRVWSEFNFHGRRIGDIVPHALFFFSIYENGAIVDPVNDSRFHSAYRSRFSGERRRPWVECAFLGTDEIKQFLRQCNLVCGSN